MTKDQWEAFCDFRLQFKAKVQEWNARLPNLSELEKSAADFYKTPAYSFETPIVYNTDLDKVTAQDEIKLIVIGDNPGKDEQLSINQRYLVGQAGKIAEGYFRRNSELGVDFRRNVIILNKTPIHSAKTNQLKKMLQLGGKDFQALLDETQIWMATQTAILHQKLSASTELWLVGYSELKSKGIFELYRNQLKSSYQNSAAWDKVYVFQHFSMNRFSIDLNDFVQGKATTVVVELVETVEPVETQQKSLQNNIHRLGLLHKTEIFN